MYEVRGTFNSIGFKDRKVTLAFWMQVIGGHVMVSFLVCGDGLTDIVGVVDLSLAWDDDVGISISKYLAQKLMLLACLLCRILAHC